MNSHAGAWERETINNQQSKGMNVEHRILNEKKTQRSEVGGRKVGGRKVGEPATENEQRATSNEKHPPKSPLEGGLRGVLTSNQQRETS